MRAPINNKKPAKTRPQKAGPTKKAKKDQKSVRLSCAIRRPVITRRCRAATITAIDPGTLHLGVALIDAQTGLMRGCDLINLCHALGWENQKSMSSTAVVNALNVVIQNDDKYGGLFSSDLIVIEGQMRRTDMITIESFFRANFPNSITVSPLLVKNHFCKYFPPDQKGSHAKNKKNAEKFGEEMAWYAFESIVKKWGDEAHHIFDALSVGLTVVEMGEERSMVIPKPSRKRSAPKTGKPKKPTSGAPRKGKKPSAKTKAAQPRSRGKTSTTTLKTKSATKRSVQPTVPVVYVD